MRAEGQGNIKDHFWIPGLHNWLTDYANHRNGKSRRTRFCGKVDALNLGHTEFKCY